MSLNTRVRLGAVVFLGLAVVLLAAPAQADPPAGEASATSPLPVQQAVLEDSSSPTIRLAGAGYYANRGRYYGGYRGYYGGNSFYRYGNPYFYRGSTLGYGYTSLYRPSYYPYSYSYSPYAYRGLSYYQPYYSYYYRRPYAYTTPLSLYGVYSAPSYWYYNPAVPASYGGCYYW